jgi:DNA-binding MarR family transcriptional regulator
MPAKKNTSAKPLRDFVPSPEQASYLQGLAAIEKALSPSGAPVLGLYAHTLNLWLARTLAEDKSFQNIVPHLLGTPAVLSVMPGLSQVELANLLGRQRATIGLQVTQCLAEGLIRRVDSGKDLRRYELFVTAKGRRFVAAARRAVPAHEARFARNLNTAERRQLRRLLRKLISV